MSKNQQHGSALIVALVFLLAMSLIGVTAMRDTTQQESMAGNARQRNLAFQAAEAALRDGENKLQGAVPAFSSWDSCTGYCDPPTDATTLSKSAVELWMDYCWITGTGCATDRSIEYTGGIGAELSDEPRFVIEKLSVTAMDDLGVGAVAPKQIYRVTARGVGETADAVVILQTIYRKE